MPGAARRYRWCHRHGPLARRNVRQGVHAGRLLPRAGRQVRGLSAGAGAQGIVEGLALAEEAGAQGTLPGRPQAAEEGPLRDVWRPVRVRHPPLRPSDAEEGPGG
eukprot:7247949-Pyramimonas_sp.AAC.1